MSGMSEQKLQDNLRDLLEEMSYLDRADRQYMGLHGLQWMEDADCETYEDACLMTHDKGIVLRLRGGETFQISIIRSE